MSSKEKKEKKLMNLKMIWGKKEKKSTDSHPKLPPTSNPSLSHVSSYQTSSNQSSKATSSTNTRDLSSSINKNQISSKDMKPVNNNTLPTKDKDKDTISNTNFDKVIVPANGVTYIADKIAGNGSFGVVVRATIQETGQVVAIKKVLQDKRYKNRELQIMQMLSHPNIVELKESFFTNGDKTDEVFLNLVLEYIPDNAFRVTRHFVKMQKSLPMLHIKLYTYQLLRSLAYIHSLGICHRDIKPQNLLLDPQSHVLKLCDFGSAKVLVKGEAHVSYICSRFYRAPELIFGSTNYTTAIDIWSAGCVMAEFLLGTPLFPGESGVDQLVEIIKILGTPTREQIQSMNSTYTDYKFPQIPGVAWPKVFNSKVDSSGLDLISKLLEYTPTLRIPPMQALAHPFFDELRDPKTSIPNKPLPPLFNFTEAEKKEMKVLGIYEKLLPRQD